LRQKCGAAGTRQHGWPDGHWDWPIHLPWKHGCRAGDLVTVGAAPLPFLAYEAMVVEIEVIAVAASSSPA
jgi:hypothetical protein